MTTVKFTIKYRSDNKVTLSYLRKVLDYNPKTGLFTWIRTLSSRAAKGSVVKGSKSNKYIYIRINKKDYLAHRLAWFYMTGKWPKLDIDHKNGNKKDNKWSNLRLATKTQNSQNREKQSNNSHGFKGVSKFKKNLSKPYVATIQFNGKRINLGYFESANKASLAYEKAAKNLFGKFNRKN